MYGMYSTLAESTIRYRTVPYSEFASGYSRMAGSTNEQKSHLGEIMISSNGEKPSILLIEEDDETRPVLRHNLIRDGYLVLLALDEEDAIERISGRQVNADLILINLVGRSVEATLQAGRRVREHVESDGMTPLVVMAEKYGKDVEGTDVNVGGNDWIFYLGEELEQLHNLLHRLLGKSEQQHS